MRLKSIDVAKVMSLTGFLVLLFSTYYVRSQVLAINRIKFSSDNVRAEENLERMKESYPDRMEEYKARLKNYEWKMEHYRKLLELYKTDYDEYARRRVQVPPSLPARPTKPRSPEVSEKLTEINSAFRAQKYHYFSSMGTLNWVACAAALSLVGGLVYLLMFDTGVQRIYYAVVLGMSFIFMIGPSFHSILTALVGFLRAPGLD